MNIYTEWKQKIDVEAAVAVGEINTRRLISEEYIRMNARLHQANESYGTSGRNYADDVLKVHSIVQAVSILDYGSGKGTLKASLPQGLDVREYDPAIPLIAMHPEPADLVVCTDVLEHIEPDYLAEVLEDIHSLAVKGVYLTVATRPAKKFLEDGRNAHLIVEPATWWISKINACFNDSKGGGYQFDQKHLMVWLAK